MLEIITILMLIFTPHNAQTKEALINCYLDSYVTLISITAPNSKYIEGNPILHNIFKAVNYKKKAMEFVLCIEMINEAILITKYPALTKIYSMSSFIGIYSWANTEYFDIDKFQIILYEKEF